MSLVLPNFVLSVLTWCFMVGSGIGLCQSRRIFLPTFRLQNNILVIKKNSPLRWITPQSPYMYNVGLINDADYRRVKNSTLGNISVIWIYSLIRRSGTSKPSLWMFLIISVHLVIVQSFLRNIFCFDNATINDYIHAAEIRLNVNNSAFCMTNLKSRYNQLKQTKNI